MFCQNATLEFQAEEIIEFWFGQSEITEVYYASKLRLWFWGENKEFDKACKDRFSSYLESTKFDPWRISDARICLGLILLFDQIPRNSFRGTKMTWAYDHIAQQLALHALKTGLDQKLNLVERMFLYLPFEHAEEISLQNLSVKKFEELHLEAPVSVKNFTELALKKAIEHRETILQHGHFPSRAR